jgi:hypothetical protein
MSRNPGARRKELRAAERRAKKQDKIAARQAARQAPRRRCRRRQRRQVIVSPRGGGGYGRTGHIIIPVPDGEEQGTVPSVPPPVLELRGAVALSAKGRATGPHMRLWTTSSQQEIEPTSRLGLFIIEEA